MALILYMIMILTLTVISAGLQKKEQLCHAAYVGLIYSAVRVFVSVIVKNRKLQTTSDFLILYGHMNGLTQHIIEITTNLSSLILFMLIPVSVGTFTDPGVFELMICYSIALLGYYVPQLDLKQKALEKRDSILRDFPSFGMDLAVLTKSGMSLEKSWRMALRDKTSVLYKEARLMIIRIEAGISLEESIITFARRLGVPEIYSFATVVSQAYKSGEAGAADIIRDYAVMSFGKRCKRAGEKGEKASVKMVFPLAMGLVGIILIVAFPAFAVMKGLV